MKKGIILAFAASIISGIAIFYSKISVAKLDPLVLTTSRNLYAGFLFMILFLTKNKWKEFKNLKKNQIVKLILAGLIGGGLPFYLFFTGLAYTQAITANAIHKSLFIWVTILAVFFLKEKLNFFYLVSFTLVFLANFSFANLKFTFSAGELMILAATMLWSIENILVKKVLKNVSSELVGLFRMGIGGSLLLITTILTGKGQLLVNIFNLSSSAEATAGRQLTVILIGGTILFFYVFTWYKALKYAPASLVTLILSFSVVVGSLLNGSFAGVKVLPRDLNTSILLGIALLILLTPIFIKKFRHLYLK